MIHEDYAVERLGQEGRPEYAGCESVNLALARRSTLVVRFTTVGDELRVAVVPSVKGVEEIAMSRLIPGLCGTGNLRLTSQYFQETEPGLFDSSIAESVSSY